MSMLFVPPLAHFLWTYILRRGVPYSKVQEDLQFGDKALEWVDAILIIKKFYSIKS